MKYLKTVSIVLLAAAVTFTSCRKKDKENVDPTSLQQLSKDETQMTNASDEAMSDANSVASGAKAFNLCDATIYPDSFSVNNDTLIKRIVFNGNQCLPNKTRLGTIIVRRLKNIPWSTANTSIWVKFINYKVTKGTKSVTINGTKTFTNVSGGVLANLNNSTIVHRIEGSVQATFDNGTSRSWNIARQRTYSGTAANYVITNDGFGQSNGYTNLVTWGTNRHGEAFYTQILQGIDLRQICGWDPVKGQKKHIIPSDNKSATVTFGYNSANELISTINTPSECPSKYKVVWEKNGNSGTVFLDLP